MKIYEVDLFERSLCGHSLFLRRGGNVVGRHSQSLFRDRLNLQAETKEKIVYKFGFRPPQYVRAILDASLGTLAIYHGRHVIDHRVAERLA